MLSTCGQYFQLTKWNTRRSKAWLHNNFVLQCRFLTKTNSNSYFTLCSFPSRWRKLKNISDLFFSLILGLNLLPIILLIYMVTGHLWRSKCFEVNILFNISFHWHLNCWILRSTRVPCFNCNTADYWLTHCCYSSVQNKQFSDFFRRNAFLLALTIRLIEWKVANLHCKLAVISSVENSFH